MRSLLIGSAARAPAPTPWAATRLPGPFASGLFPESSRTFQILEKLFVPLLSLCKPDMWDFLSSFQLTPCRNRHSPKLVEFYQ
jgi:hypothetical protein